MKLSRRILARHIAKELAEGANRTEVIEQLAAYIVVHKLHGSIELIVSDISANLARIGHVSATVTSARPLTSEVQSAVQSFIRKLEGAHQLELTELVDDSLLGGIIIETPSRRFDASVKTRLKRLKNA